MQWSEQRALRIDGHVHMVGNGSNGSGCRLQLRGGLRRLMARSMMRELRLPASALTGNLEDLYLQRLLEWIRASSLSHVALLAQDWVRDARGNPLESQTALYVPNEYVLGI